MKYAKMSYIDKWDPSHLNSTKRRRQKEKKNLVTHMK